VSRCVPSPPGSMRCRPRADCLGAIPSSPAGSFWTNEESAAILNFIGLGSGNVPLQLERELAYAANECNANWLEVDDRWLASIACCQSDPDWSIGRSIVVVIPTSATGKSCSTPTVSGRSKPDVLADLGSSGGARDTGRLPHYRPRGKRASVLA